MSDEEEKTAMASSSVLGGGSSRGGGLMRYHHQNLTDGRLPLWRHGRAWWWRFAWEWNVFHKIGLQSASVGKWGFAVYLRWFGLHFAGRNGLRRTWSISWHDERLWLGHPWWKKTIVLSVVDWLIGRSRFEIVNGEPFDVVVPLPEGSYRAVATPHKLTWRRRWYWPLKRKNGVSLDIPGGIPFAGKGENSWDCGDDGLCGCGGDTVEDAIANAVKHVLRSRRRYGHDSKGTGSASAIVLNDKEGA